MVQGNCKTTSSLRGAAVLATGPERVRRRWYGRRLLFRFRDGREPIMLPRSRRTLVLRPGISPMTSPSLPSPLPLRLALALLFVRCSSGAAPPPAFTLLMASCGSAISGFWTFSPALAVLAEGCLTSGMAAKRMFAPVFFLGRSALGPSDDLLVWSKFRSWRRGGATPGRRGDIPRLVSGDRGVVDLDGGVGAAGGLAGVLAGALVTVSSSPPPLSREWRPERAGVGSATEGAASSLVASTGASSTAATSSSTVSSTIGGASTSRAGDAISPIFFLLPVLRGRTGAPISGSAGASVVAELPAMKALICEISVSSRLASADPLPLILAFSQISSRALLSRPSSFANA